MPGAVTITAGFTVTKSASPSAGVLAGSTTPIVYTLTVTNDAAGPSTSPVVVHDTVPSGTTLVAGSAACTGGPPSCSVTVTGTAISWSIPAGVPSRGVYTLTFSVTANANDVTGTISNVATWNGPGCDASTCPTNTTSTPVTGAPITLPGTTPPTTVPTTPPVVTAPIAFTGAFLSTEWMIGLGSILLGVGLLLIVRRRRPATDE